MRRLIFLTLFILSAGRLLITAQQQSSRTATTAELRKLLSRPAPTPRVADEVEKRDKKPPRPPEFYDRAKTPPDDAPIADLLDYWERPRLSRSEPEPSEATRQRLLAATEGEPERLPSFLHLLPQNAATAERVKKLYDEALTSDHFDEDWRKKVRDWLRFNSKYFLGELLALARKAKDDKDGYVDNEEALQALAKVDWPTAEPLLQSLSGGEPRTAALAAALLYRHAVESKEESAAGNYRERLMTMAASRSLPAAARDTAIEELSLGDWPGLDEWYMSLLDDETLLEPSDGSFGFSPLTELFDRQPDKWIPVMAKLVESPNRATRQAAASCLVRYSTSDHKRRKDAILPVLRWLSDPDWLEINSTQRAWFIQVMDDLELPESVPGLIWIIEHEEDNRGWAARTLAHYKDPRAIPALKKALTQGSGSYGIEHLIQCLLASGGLSEDEQLAALEAYAAKIATPEGREEVERHRGYGDAPLNIQVAIGQYLARQNEVSEGLASLALARAESLQSKSPAVARELLAVAQGWRSRLVELDMLRRIGAGVADAKIIVKSLERRERLREGAGRELRTLMDAGGAAPGIAAVLLADEALAHSILDTGDQLAQFALLACARLTQMTLPAEKVGSLLGAREADLALAAERYLLAEDSPDARRFLLERHPNAAFITGWRENVPMIGGSNFDAIGRVEEKLRSEVLQENGPREIYALLQNYKHAHLILRVYPNRAVYTAYEDAARYRERVIPQAELAKFKDFITNNKLAEMGPQFGPCHYDCMAAEFLSLTRQGGRRVFGHQSAWSWLSIISNFNLLGQGDGARVHYYIEEKIKGLELLYAGETPRALDVWRQGADLRMFVERESTPEEIEQERMDDAVEDDDDDEDARAERRRRAVERERARFSWRKFDGGALGAETTRPPGYSTFDEASFEIERDDFPAHLNNHLVQAVAGKSVVLARSSEKGGLWKKAAGKKPERLSRAGVYAHPLVTPDGKWAVAAKTDSNWGEPNYVVRFNLQTRREYRVDLPPADQFDSVAYVAAHNKVLLRRARDEEKKSSDPETPEFYLLDAATGRTQKVTGEFAPLLQEGQRSLQPTGKPFEYWAAIPDRENNRTRVGRYNSRDFSFQTAFDVQQLTFDSFSMWVDEKEAKLLVIYEGQLLRAPFH